MMHMQMVFYWGIEATVLFDWWKITTHWQYFWSICAIIAMGISCQLLKQYRDNINKRSMQRRPRYISSEERTTHPLLATDNTSGSDLSGKTYDGKMSETMFTLPIFERSVDMCLCAAHTTLSFFLMLISMTFNVGLFAAVVFGLAFGCFLTKGPWCPCVRMQASPGVLRYSEDPRNL
eukprot:394083_1